VIPGARLENITNLADSEISILGKNDTVIVIGGANDINKNETITRLTHLKKFVDNSRNTNIMVMTAPHRHDLHGSSCVNKEIVTYNRKLHKVVKTVGNVKIIQATLNRNDFTRHGMHLNILGKEKMAKLIGDSIKTPMTRKKETPFILKWKEEQEDPHQRETENTPTNVNKGTKLKAAGSTKRHEETPRPNRKTITHNHHRSKQRSPQNIEPDKENSNNNEQGFFMDKRPPTRVHQ